MHTNNNWGILVLNHRQIFAQPLELLLNNDVVVVSCARHILALLHLLGLLVAIANVVENNVVYIANVERVVCRTKCIAEWLCGIKICVLIRNCCAIVVVVTH